MDDMMEKIQALLSDPEAMQNIQELSAMLSENSDSVPLSSSTPPQEPSAPTVSAPQPPLPDLSKLFALRQVMSSAEDDKNITLLLALKPHLSPSRKERVDRAIKLLRIYSAASALKEQGMLDDLLAGF